MPEYFSHDFNARNDPKMIRLIQKMGHEGIGLYWCLVEYLYEQRGYLMLSQCDCIAFEMHSHIDKIKTLIHDTDLFENDGEKFWSDSVLKRIDTIIEKSGKARKSAEIRWKKGNNDANAMRTQCDNDANARQSKVNKEKEIKEIKEIKPKENNVPPKIEDVKKYCDTRLNGIDADHFFNYYESNGWHVGKNKMKSWQAAIRTWEKNDERRKTGLQRNSKKPIETGSTWSHEPECTLDGVSTG
jgi:uncharacterized protein YdaU (DUF1376 family)